MLPIIETISAAVTPVVLVSASALLVVGVGSKHQNMSDRVRNLAAEWRSPNTGARRASIERQLLLLRRRIRFSAFAHRALYISILTFLAMALLLLFDAAAVVAILILFIIGIALVVAAVACEIVELSLARRTLDDEVADIVGPSR